MSLDYLYRKMPTRSLRSSIKPILVLTGLCMLVGCEPNAHLGPVADAATAVKLREAFSSGASESGSSTAAVSTGTGWATIKGQFVFDGVPPEMKPYNANKDVETCTVNGVAPPQESLIVDDSSKGIRNVVVFARKVTRVHESAQPKTDSFLFDQKNMCVFVTCFSSDSWSDNYDQK